MNKTLTFLKETHGSEEGIMKTCSFSLEQDTQHTYLCEAKGSFKGLFLANSPQSTMPIQTI